MPPALLAMLALTLASPLAIAQAAPTAPATLPEDAEAAAVERASVDPSHAPAPAFGGAGALLFFAAIGASIGGVVGLGRYQRRRTRTVALGVLRDGK